MRRYIILSAFLLSSLFSFSQEKLVWFVLQQTTYEVTEESGALGNFKPRFSKTLEKYDGKEVIIQGFIIPMEVSDNKYVLSMNPFSSCFFCGNAGPETVIELIFKDPQSKFLTDQFILVKGILRLNRYSTGGFFYTLENAENHG